jgi:threonine synthase
LEYTYNFKNLSKINFIGSFNFWRYKAFLPKVKNIISLGEGGTPIHKAKRLGKMLKANFLFLKDETRNPTNSFRDRSASLMVSNAVDLNYDTILCATNGNLGASLAAYCAKTGISCHLIVPKLVDIGKLAQMLIFDAVIEEHGEIVDEAIKHAESIAKETGWYQATPELNPLVIEAQKTIAYEVIEQIGAPDWFIISMGSGGVVYSVWKGFKELKRLGVIETLPHIVGVQAEKCAPITNAFMKGKNKPHIARTKNYTRAWAIMVRNPLYGELALHAIKESQGLATIVTDDQILEAEQEIAKREGIFAEPSSAATVAAFKKLLNENIIQKNDVVVCLITGSGLKATDVLQALTKKKKTAAVGLELSTKEKILRILCEKDAYGYELWKKLGKVMTRAAVYQHLNELSKNGLILNYEKDGRKYFKITRRGIKVLRAFDDLKLLL